MVDVARQDDGYSMSWDDRHIGSEAFKDQLRKELAAFDAAIEALAESVESSKERYPNGNLQGTVANSSFDDLANGALPGAQNAEVDEVAAAARERKKKFESGVIKFNHKAKDGIQFFEDHGFLEHTPQAHAKFLLETPGLFKTQIGQWLGVLSKDFNREVLKCFVNSFNFENVGLDEALRTFLSTFRLPGEAQQIDVMMETFAKRFHLHNPSTFSGPDTAYILCFALIMLNTDAHNPSIKNKMTLEQFLKTTRGIDDGKDVDHEYLETLYNSIVSNEIKMDPEGEPSTFDNPDKEGWLRKQGGRIKTWKNRHFVLTGNCLYYFENDKPNGAAPKGILPLENLAVRPTGSSKSGQFEIYHPTEKMLKAGKLVSGGMTESRHERFLLQAADQAEMEEWVAAVSAHMCKDPFYTLLQSKMKSLEVEVGEQGGGKKGERAVMEKRRTMSQRQLDLNSGNNSSGSGMML